MFHYGPNTPPVRHAPYLNSQQFRVHEPVGMLVTGHTQGVPHVVSAPQVDGPKIRAWTSYPSKMYYPKTG